jgi:uracil phosphoribosyltransferase
MAAAMAAPLYQEAGIPAEVFSAGVSVYGPAPASRHAVNVMKSRNIDISAHASRPITPELAESAALILTMTCRHRDMLLDSFPHLADKTFCLGEFAGDGKSISPPQNSEPPSCKSGAIHLNIERKNVIHPPRSAERHTDIPDPYGGSFFDYDLCADMIEQFLINSIIKIREGYMTNDSAKMLHVTDHPLVQSKITMLRNIETGNKEFRELVGEIATLIGYEATRDIPLADIEVETPIQRTGGKICARKFGIVPILRAGLGMVEGLSHLLPTAKIGHIGLYRDPESLQPVEYYCKLPPDCAEREMYLLDPMLATGGTASAAIGYLKDRGVKRIKLLCLIAAPEGVQKLWEEHPDVRIYTAAYDECLNSHGYIVPGLGDAGDRLFGTK